MQRFTICSITVLVLMHCGIDARAQLFKGRAQRQSGGNNVGRQQSQGGLFQRGRERRAERAEQTNSQPSSNSNMTQKSGGGLFGRGKERRESGSGLFNKKRSSTSNGQPVEKGGLFSKAKQRKQDRAEQPYSGNNSQQSTSYVRSNQRITSPSPLFQSSNRTAENSQPGVPTVSLKPNVSTRPVAVATPTPRTDSNRPQLPALVKSPAAPTLRPRPPAKDSGDAKRVSRRRETTPNRMNPERLRKRSSPNTNTQPTGNLPNLNQRQAEPDDAALA